MITIIRHSKIHWSSSNHQLVIHLEEKVGQASSMETTIKLPWVHEGREREETKGKRKKGYCGVGQWPFALLNVLAKVCVNFIEHCSYSSHRFHHHLYIYTHTHTHANRILISSLFCACLNRMSCSRPFYKISVGLVTLMVYKF